MSSSNKFLYSIFDTVAGEYVGGIQLHRHAASAIRVFSDILQTPGSMPQSHPEDYELHCLGALHDTPRRLDETSADLVVVDPRSFSVVITGASWLAAQSSTTPESNP